MNGMINYDTIAGDNQFISVYHNIDSLTSIDTPSLCSIMEPRDLAFKYHNNAVSSNELFVLSYVSDI